MNTTTRAMIDLLFTLRNAKHKVDEINKMISKLNHDNDFPPRISATCGEIEQKLVDALNIYFNEITGCSGIAEHMLYETGIICSKEGVKYDLKLYDGFEKFIADFSAN